MPLYGNDLDTSTNPYEAGLGRVVKLDKPGDFVGRAALRKVAEEGPARAPVGLIVARPRASPAMATRSWPRSAGPGSSPAARSRRPWACRSPWPTSRRATREPGTMLDVEIRDQPVPAEVVSLPFYRRAH